jgi:hypothetical protein
VSLCVTEDQVSALGPGTFLTVVGGAHWSQNPKLHSVVWKYPDCLEQEQVKQTARTADARLRQTPRPLMPQLTDRLTRQQLWFRWPWILCSNRPACFIFAHSVQRLSPCAEPVGYFVTISLGRLNQRRRVRLVSTGIFAQDGIVFGEAIRHVEVLAEGLGVMIDGTA